MRIGLLPEVKPQLKKDKVKTGPSMGSLQAEQSTKMSYLDIPKIAFSGNNIIRRQKDEELRLDKLGTMPLTIGEPVKFNLTKPILPSTVETQMFVNPQDPLVTKPELMTFHTQKPITKGPEGERVKIVDYSSKLAEPNNRGNYIFPENSSQFDQVQSFAIVKQTFDMFQNLLGRSLDWGFNSKKLSVYPHAGNMMNAYYSRNDRAIKLFEFVRPDTGKVVKTCQSADIVAHETGHATLDGIKPKYLENFGFGVAGFHEALADTSAMLLGLQNDGLINRMLEMTKGDLRKDNIIACMAEEFGDAIHKNDRNPKTDNMQYLRNAINYFVQKPLKEMPYYDRANNDTVLGLESHSYSRLFLGANYDIFTGIYDKVKKAETPDAQKYAVMTARDTFAKIFARSLEFAPAGETSFKDNAIAMIKADIIDNKGANREIMEKVFTERKILTADDIAKVDAEMKSLPELTLPETVKSSSQVMQFIADNRDALGIPEGLNIRPLEAFINNKGEKHIICATDNPVILEGMKFGRYQGQSVNVMGTFSIAFDQDNKLINKTFKEITPEVQDDVLYAIELMIKHMMRAKEEQGKTGDINKDLTQLAVPELLSVKSELGEYTEIKKAPVIVDPIDDSKRGPKALGEYFKKLQAMKSA